MGCEMWGTELEYNMKEDNTHCLGFDNVLTESIHAVQSLWTFLQKYDGKSKNKSLR